MEALQMLTDAITDLTRGDIGIAEKQIAFQFLVDNSPLPQNAEAMMHLGIVDAIVPFLSQESDVCHMYTCHILANLSILEHNQFTIGQLPIYDKLVNILSTSRNGYVLEKILMLLTNLSCCENNYNEFMNYNIIEHVVNILEFVNEEISYRATLLIQNLLHLESTKDYFFNHNGMKILCRMISRLPSERILHSTSVIISILSFENTKKLIDGGILPIVLLQLRSNNPDIAQQVIRTITNISADNEGRGFLFSSGIVPILIELLEITEDLEVLEHTLITLSNLSLTEQNSTEIANIGGIPFILSILSSSNEGDILVRVAKIISNLALYSVPKALLVKSIPLLESKIATSNHNNFIHFSNLAIKRLQVSSASPAVVMQPIRNEPNRPMMQTPKPAEAPSVMVVDADKLSKDHVRRVRIINEIVETEKTYVFQLLSIIQNYIKPLQAMIDGGKPLISEITLKEIFSTVELLFKMHAGFLQKLEKSIQMKNTGLNDNLDEVRVGDVFLGLVDCLRMYRNYISNYDKSIDSLSTSLENVKFRTFCENQQLNDPEGQPLSAMLITPIQRIPRYSLLLQDLIRHMPEDHDDFQNVNNALQGVLGVANYLNQERGKTEAVNKVINIQEQFTNLPVKLVEPHRTFIKEGDVIAENSKSKNLQYHRFFLFSDILVEGIQKGDKFRHKNIFDLQFTKVITLANSNQSFRLITQDDGFSFSVDSQHDRDSWVQIIANAINESKRNSMQRKVASLSSIKNALITPQGAPSS